MPDTQHSLKLALEQGVFLKIGHRGLPSEVLENTLASFQAAYAAGATMIECDVQLSKDKVAVIHHDETMERLWQGQGKVSETHSDILLALEPRNKENVSIPSLAQLCQWLQGNDLFLYLELKSFRDDHESLLAAAIAEIERYQLQERVLWVSFDWDLLAALHQKRPNYLLGANIDTESELEALFLRKLPLTAICPNYRFVTKEHCQIWRQMGLFICPYTVNEHQDMRRLQRYGVSAITTNFIRMLSS